MRIKKCEFGRRFTRVEKLFCGIRSVGARQVGFVCLSRVGLQVIVVVCFLSVMRCVGGAFEVGRVERASRGVLRVLEQPTTFWFIAICLAVVCPMAVLSALHTISIICIFASVRLGQIGFFIFVGFERCFAMSVGLSLGSSRC